MARKTDAIWTSRVTAWRASGQTAPQFAAGKGFAASTLRYWASKLKRQGSEGAAVTFARVERLEAAGARPVTIVLREARIEVFADTDEAALEKALRALGGAR